ncbi:S9 family peptidase [Actinomadura montaniterrae]|uniref:S9 family peptidase n=1 Tax=Actinomadura montaniterrae TaxID=1803903 RepID=A0A6L3W6M9_9ACTN|nr:S9 family peptidase [Actinomadura montaniterrae]KAB2388662.1 S9 family peptidase [Actinomadura montaniterrae]
MPEYQDFVPNQRIRPSLALSPDGSMVAYSGNAGGSFDLWVLSIATGEARQLTELADQAVQQVAWMPDGKSVVFSADRQGDEQFRLYRVDVDGTNLGELSSGPDCQRILATVPFDAAGRYLAYAANDRDEAVQDLIVRDLADDTERRIVPPAEVAFEPASVSPDGKWLLAAGFRSNTDVALYLVDLEAGEEPVCVTAEFGGGVFEPGPWMADSAGFYLLTNLWSEFAAAARYRLGGTLEPVAQHDWDVELIDTAGDALIWSVNEAGRSTLHASGGGEAVGLPEIPSGVVTSLALAPGGRAAVVLIDAATRPVEIAILDRDSGFRYLTDGRPPALHVVEPAAPESITYPAAGGRRVQGLLYRPHRPGPHPVLLSIHGGPEDQERPRYVFSGLYQHLLNEGIAVFAPNIAGSTGYGSAHQKLIYRDWGGVDLDDLDHAVRYLRSARDLDTDRMAAMGASYGGFAALSCLSRLPYEWAAGVSLCGPTNLVTLARECPPTWKTFVATVLGDPVKDLDYLTERSPVTHADAIGAPLLILQGGRDPRVPRTESDHFVDRLRERGVEVAYEVFEDEGHGFSQRKNELRAYEQTAAFLTRHLLAKG